MLFKEEIMNKDGRSHKNKIDKDFQTRAVRLKNSRAKEAGKQLSYTKIADDSNLDCAVVKRIMKGERGATLAEAYAIAEALNTTVHHLINKGEQTPVVANYLKLLEFITSRRGQVVRELEELTETLKIIDRQIEMSKIVLSPEY